MPDPTVTQPRPTLAVGGVVQPQLAATTLSLHVLDDGAAAARLVLHLSAWGLTASGVGYLYEDGALLDLGREIAVTIGEESLFAGRVTALEGRFSDVSPATLVLSAEGALPSAASAPPMLTLGQGLLTFTATEREEVTQVEAPAGRVRRSSSAMPVQRVVEGWGTAEGEVRLRSDAAVRLSGLGARFDGDYRIAESRHEFDLSAGYRTRFRAERRL